MTKKIQVPATLEGISTLKDGGASVRFHTQELSDEDLAVLFKYTDKFGWLIFAETEAEVQDIKELEAIRKDTGGKSPSQRLRGALFVLWQQRGDTNTSFEQFYSQQMEKVIENVKGRLT
jgi:hypothetical protein